MFATFGKYHRLQCIYVYKKNYPASCSQHIFMVFVSFESYMNKALNKGYLVKFQHCIFHLRQFEVKENFVIDANGDVA